MVLEDTDRLVAEPIALNVSHLIVAPYPVSDQPASAQPVSGEPFVVELFGALVCAARRSKRNQADVAAALARAQLACDRQKLTLALDNLRQDEFIDRLIPLEDGGLFVTLTNKGLKRARELGYGSPMDAQPV